MGNNLREISSMLLKQSNDFENKRIEFTKQEVQIQITEEERIYDKIIQLKEELEIEIDKYQEYYGRWIEDINGEQIWETDVPTSEERYWNMKFKLDFIYELLETE